MKNKEEIANYLKSLLKEFEDRLEYLKSPQAVEDGLTKICIRCHISELSSVIISVQKLLIDGKTTFEDVYKVCASISSRLGYIQTDQAVKDGMNAKEVNYMFDVLSYLFVSFNILRQRILTV